MPYDIWCAWYDNCIYYTNLANNAFKRGDMETYNVYMNEVNRIKAKINFGNIQFDEIDSNTHTYEHGISL